MVIPPRQFGRVLADAMNSLARTWKTLLVPAISVFVPVAVLTIVVFRVTGGGEFLDLIVNNPERLAGLPQEVFIELARPFYTSVAVAFLLQICAGVFVALASHRAVGSDMNRSQVTAGEASRLAMRRYPVAIGASILIVLVVGALLIMGMVVWLLPAISVGTPNVASLFVALGLLFVLLAPGIWVGVSMSMTTSIVVLEGTGVLVSIRRSMSLVRGRWWPTAAFLLLVGALGGIAIQLIQLIAIPLFGVDGGGTALTIASALGVLTQGLLVAAIAAMYTHWYIDLRARREDLTTSDLG